MDEQLHSSGEESDYLYDRVDGLLSTIRENISNDSESSSIPEPQPQACRSKEFYTYEERQAILQQAMEARHCAWEVRRCAKEIQIESQLLMQQIYLSQKRPLCDV